MLFLVFFIVVALLVALKGNKKFILFFMAFYPVLPDYFAIELGGGLPLLKASRILLLILMLCVCFHNKKIHLIRQPLKVTGLYWPLFIYFAARILANGYYAPSLSAAINTEFTVIVEQLLLIVMICQVVGYQSSTVLDEPEREAGTTSIPIPQREESENIPSPDLPEQLENVQQSGNEIAERGMQT